MKEEKLWDVFTDILRETLGLFLDALFIMLGYNVLRIKLLPILPYLTYWEILVLCMGISCLSDLFVFDVKIRKKGE